MDRAEDEAIAGLPTNGNTPPLSELLAVVVVVRIPAGGSIDFQLASIRSPYSPEISVREIPAGNTKLSNRKLVSSSKANRWIGSWFKAGPFEQSKYREGMESGSERSSVGQLFLVQRYPGRSKWHTDCSLDNGRPSSLAWSCFIEKSVSAVPYEFSTYFYAFLRYPWVRTVLVDERARKKKEEKDASPTIHPHVLRDEEDFGCGL
ncbi:hypothetical protein HZH66_002405 [Vespula vulgaris]|uniref:Uncharacterized protein n=1 Tax=Vespula vulgaris TaxID=7454 RepID=A0A834NHQ8_VESVU|nr:hypothetical protein HZH66_002405 [Vespula vulgaris]